MSLNASRAATSNTRLVPPRDLIVTANGSYHREDVTLAPFVWGPKDPDVPVRVPSVASLIAPPTPPIPYRRLPMPRDCYCDPIDFALNGPPAMRPGQLYINIRAPPENRDRPPYIYRAAVPLPIYPYEGRLEISNPYGQLMAVKWFTYVRPSPEFDKMKIGPDTYNFERAWYHPSRRSGPPADQVLDGLPVVMVDNGRSPLPTRESDAEKLVWTFEL